MRAPPPPASRRAAAAAHALAALLPLLAAAAARAQFGGADVPPEVAIRWAALDPKKWNVRPPARALARMLPPARMPLPPGAGAGRTPPSPAAPAPPRPPPQFTQLQTALPLLRPPPGFKVDLYFTGQSRDRGLINNARSLAVSGNSKHPGGPIITYVSSKMAKRVYALIDWTGDGTADKLVEIANGLDKPQGMDWYKCAARARARKRRARPRVGARRAAHRRPAGRARRGLRPRARPHARRRRRARARARARPPGATCT